MAIVRVVYAEGEQLYYDATASVDAETGTLSILRDGLALAEFPKDSYVSYEQVERHPVPAMPATPEPDTTLPEL